MNALIRNMISLVAAVAFFWFPPKKLWASHPDGTKGVPKIEDIEKVKKDTPLYLMHADDLFGKRTDAFAGHRSHSSHRSHASHSSHQSHYSSRTTPSPSPETTTPAVPEKAPSMPKEEPTKAQPSLPQSKGQAESFFNLGASASQKGHYDEAIIHYKKALNLNPNYEHALNNLGVIYFKKGEEEKAIELLEKAITANASYGDPYYNLGAIYHNKGLSQKALEYFTKGCNLGNADACKAMKGNY